MHYALASKVDTLSLLNILLTDSTVDPLFAFTLKDWQSDQGRIVCAVQSRFPDQVVFIRSSAIDEDTPQGCGAGYFHSEPNVHSLEQNELSEAIEKVVASYAKGGRNLRQTDQVFVQPQVSDVMMCGVVLTRCPRYNAPYYVINYDNWSGRTDTVTKGLRSKVIRVAHWERATNLESPWRDVILAVQEIEDVFGEKALEVEFATDRQGRIHIFQVRQLLIPPHPAGVQDQEIREAIQGLTAEFELISSRRYGLAGSPCVLGDMPDWNPAEIIGNRANVLAYSLYRFLITQSAWSRGRVLLGYTDVAPAELMVRLADKPYIDARASFTSLTPASLSVEFREALVDYYLAKLSATPSLQDKVEFEILLTCYDLSFCRRSADLRSSGFSEADIEYLGRHLRILTNNMLQDWRRTVRQDLLAIRKLRVQIEHHTAQESPYLLQKAYDLLLQCRELGAIPFARQARLAFVGIALLRSIVDQDIISRELHDGFLNSVETKVSVLRRDTRRLASGTMSPDLFMKAYGHLRPGTYDILAPRYDHLPSLFDGFGTSSYEERAASSNGFDAIAVNKITKALGKHDLCCSGAELISFIRIALQLRESIKFEFTKGLSEVIELIARVGAEMDFSRHDLSFLDWDTLLQFRHMHPSDVSHVRSDWDELIARNRWQKDIYSSIALPPVITSVKDFTSVSHYDARPNFITHRSIEGNVLYLGEVDYRAIPNLAEQIVLLERADPGYDWIFTQPIKGLVTQYGGIASHMAIRCAELGLPAIIGCGEVIFDQLKVARRIRVDCMEESMTVLESSLR